MDSSKSKNLSENDWEQQDTMMGLNFMAPSTLLKLDAKPKHVPKSKLPGTVSIPKSKACNAKGKGQKCSMKPFQDIILQANKNIESLQDIVEKKTDDHIKCWDTSRDIISQYENINKGMAKQLSSTSKQLAVLQGK